MKKTLFIFLVVGFLLIPVSVLAEDNPLLTIYEGIKKGETRIELVEKIIKDCRNRRRLFHGFISLGGVTQEIHKMTKLWIWEDLRWKKRSRSRAELTLFFENGILQGAQYEYTFLEHKKKLEK